MSKLAAVSSPFVERLENAMRCGSDVGGHVPHVRVDSAGCSRGLEDRPLAARDAGVWKTPKSGGSVKASRTTSGAPCIAGRPRRWRPSSELHRARRQLLGDGQRRRIQPSSLLARALRQTCAMSVEAVIALVSVVVAIAVGVVGVLAVRRWGVRRRQLVLMTTSSRLLLTDPTLGALRVTYEEKEVDDPYLLTLSLLNNGPADVATEHFDDRRPLRINLSQSVYGITGTSHPRFTATSDATNPKGYVDFGPSLIRRREKWTVEAIVSGKVTAEVENSIVDMDIIDGTTAARRQLRRNRFVLGAGVLLGSLLLLWVALPAATVDAPEAVSFVNKHVATVTSSPTEAYHSYMSADAQGVTPLPNFVMYWQTVSGVSDVSVAPLPEPRNVFVVTYNTTQKGEATTERVSSRWQLVCVGWRSRIPLGSCDPASIRLQSASPFQ